MSKSLKERIVYAASRRTAIRMVVIVGLTGYIFVKCLARYTFKKDKNRKIALATAAAMITAISAPAPGLLYADNKSDLDAKVRTSTKTEFENVTSYVVRITNKGDEPINNIKIKAKGLKLVLDLKATAENNDIPDAPTNDTPAYVEVGNNISSENEIIIPDEISAPGENTNPEGITAPDGSTIPSVDVKPGNNNTDETNNPILDSLEPGESIDIGIIPDDSGKDEGEIKVSGDGEEGKETDEANVTTGQMDDMLSNQEKQNEENPTPDESDENDLDDTQNGTSSSGNPNTDSFDDTQKSDEPESDPEDGSVDTVDDETGAETEDETDPETEGGDLSDETDDELEGEDDIEEDSEKDLESPDKEETKEESEQESEEKSEEDEESEEDTEEEDEEGKKERDIISVTLPTTFEIPMFEIGDSVAVMSEDIPICNMSDFPLDVSVTSVNLDVGASIDKDRVKSSRIEVDTEEVFNLDEIASHCNIFMNVIGYENGMSTYFIPEGTSYNVTSFRLSECKDLPNMQRIMNSRFIETCDSPDYAVINLRGSVMDGIMIDEAKCNMSVRVTFDFDKVE